MRRFAVLALASPLLAVCARAQGASPPPTAAAAAEAPAAPFEGVITSAASLGGREVPLTYSVRPGALRLDVPDGEGHTSSTIFDLTAHRTLVLVPGARMYVERLTRGDARGDGDSVALEPRPEITRTGRAERIAGYVCEHWLVKDRDGRTADACMTRGLGAMPDPLGRADRRANWLASLNEGGWYPLRVTRDGAATPSLLVTAVERRALDPALFAIPAEYRRMEGPTGSSSGPERR